MSGISPRLDGFPRRRPSIERDSLAVLLLCLVLTQTAIVPVYPAYVLVFLATLPFLLWFSREHSYLADRDDLIVAALIGVIAVLFVIGIALRPSATTVIRGVGYIYGVTLFLGIVPRLVSWRTFCRVLARVATLLVVIGVPLTVTTWYGDVVSPDPLWFKPTPLPLVGVEVYPLASVLQTSTTMGAVTAFGTLAAVAEAIADRSRVASGMAAVCAFGAYLTVSRTAMASVVVGLGLVALYHVHGREVMGFAAVGAFGAICVGILMIVGLLPGPGFVDSISLTGRGQLWEVTVRSIRERPVFGWGPSDSPEIIGRYVTGHRQGMGPHNSYLRMVLMAGPIGALAYVALHSFAGWRAYVQTVDVQHAFVFAFVIVAFVNQLFNGSTLLGLSLRSSLYAFALGFGIHGVSRLPSSIGRL